LLPATESWETRSSERSPTTAEERSSLVGHDGYGQSEDAVRKAESEFGGLHVLMHVVGSNDLTVIPNIEPEGWNRIFEINVTATAGRNPHLRSADTRSSSGWRRSR
jgi:hypothetical protein